MSIDIIDKAVRRVPDFPKLGILFYDVTGIFADPKAFKSCIELSVKELKKYKIDGIAAVESRGFLIAAPIAAELGIPLVLIRKKGKLPGEVYRCSYSLEYGTAEIEVHKSDVIAGSRYAVVDDLIATGGTLNAAKTLIEQGGASVELFFGVIGLPDLEFKKALLPTPAITLINYNGA